MMMGPSRLGIVGVALLIGACSAGDNRVDPSDLELRDLLGLSPEVASTWDGAQRAAARRVLVAGFRATDAPAQLARELDATGVDERVASWLAEGDAQRAADSADPLGVVRVAVGVHGLARTARSAPRSAAAVDGTTQARTTSPAVDLWLAEQWDAERTWGHLPGRGLDLLAALAVDAEHPGGPVIVVPAPRLTVIAAYIKPYDEAARPRLAVNPVLLTALEPDPDELATTAALGRGSRTSGASGTAGTSGGTGAFVASGFASGTSGRAPGAQPALTGPVPSASTGGNPYSFYGSFEECAAAQRTRCAPCLAGGMCSPITNAPDGNTECTMLDADSGRGYFLLCINLALAISSVNECTGDAAPACQRDPDAAGELTTLANNQNFLEDSTCAGALDGCLAKIYGAPSDPFPGIDGGTAPTAPPRSTTVDCGDACSTKNNNCEASPSCDFSGPSCNNSLSCDSGCSSSNDQSGCGGNCNACTSSGGGGGGGGGDGCSGGGGGGSSGDGCSSGSGGGGSCGGGGGSGGSCGSSGSGGSCSGGSCGSSSSGGSCGGDSCGSSGSGGSCGGSSGGDSCGGSGGGGSCGGSSGGGSCGGGGGGGSCGGGGGGKCSVASSDPGPGVALALSVTWGILPVPFAALTRHRARRRRARQATSSSGDGMDAVPDPRADANAQRDAEETP